MIEIVVCFIVQLSEVKGHSWLCESLQTLSNSSQQLRDIDTKGHFGIAAKVYARIASQCLVNKQKDTSINLSLDAVSVADSLLSEYQSNDFTRTMHAYRTGMFEIDPSMFGAHQGDILAVRRNAVGRRFPAVLCRIFVIRDLQ